MERRKAPLTESECAFIVSGKLTKEQLAKRFNCSETTIRRAMASIRADDAIVYLYKRPAPFIALPLTESERDLLTHSLMTIPELAERFKCSLATVKRAKKSVRDGETDVYIFRPLVQKKKPKLRASDPAARWELRENSLGHNPVEACDAHLADLRRVHGSRAKT